MDPAPRLPHRARRHLRMYDAATRGHPLHVARSQLATMPLGVLVLGLTLEHVAHRFESSVGVVRRADGSPGRVIYGAHLVEHQERVGVREARAGEGTSNNEACPLELAVRSDCLDDVSCGHVLSSFNDQSTTSARCDGPKVRSR